MFKFFILFCVVVAFFNSRADQVESQYPKSYYDLYDRRKGEFPPSVYILSSNIGFHAQSFSLLLYSDPDLKHQVGKFWFTVGMPLMTKKDKGECTYKGKTFCKIGYEEYEEIPFFYNNKGKKGVREDVFDCRLLHFISNGDLGFFEFNKITNEWFQIVTDSEENIYISRKEFFHELNKEDPAHPESVKLRLMMSQTNYLKRLKKPFEAQKADFIKKLKGDKIDFDLNYVDGYAADEPKPRLQIEDNKIVMNKIKASSKDIEKLKNDMKKHAIELLSKVSINDFILSADLHTISFFDQSFDYDLKGKIAFKNKYLRKAYRLNLNFSGDRTAPIFKSVTVDVAFYDDAIEAEFSPSTLVFYDFIEQYLGYEDYTNPGYHTILKK